MTSAYYHCIEFNRSFLIGASAVNVGQSQQMDQSTVPTLLSLFGTIDD
jgi:hypothetical protein